MQWLGGEPISHSNGMHLAHTLAALFSVCGQYMATVFRARTNTCTQRMFHKCAFSESWYVVAVSPPLPALKTQHNKWWAKCKRRRRSQKRERRTRARSRHSPLHMPECTSLDRTALAANPIGKRFCFTYSCPLHGDPTTHTHTPSSSQGYSNTLVWQAVAYSIASQNYMQSEAPMSQLSSGRLFLSANNLLIFAPNTTKQINEDCRYFVRRMWTSLCHALRSFFSVFLLNNRLLFRWSLLWRRRRLRCDSVSVTQNTRIHIESVW